MSLLFPALVNGQVLVEIGLLGEALIAAWLLADEGTLLGMHSEVVEEIMPLAEVHLAAFEVTLKNFDLSLGPWIFVLKNSELTSGWNLLIDLDRRKVKILSWLHMDFRAIWDLIPDLSVRNFTLVNDHGLVHLHRVIKQGIGSSGLRVVSTHMHTETCSALILLGLDVLVGVAELAAGWARLHARHLVSAHPVEVERLLDDIAMPLFGCVP